MADDQFGKGAGAALRVFISYRSADSVSYARSLYHDLISHFPEGQIFWDIREIDPGADFVDAIERAVGSCDALIAVIGRQWLGILDPQGQPRLNDPADWVRLEIATALDRNILVIPVLVQGAPMPAAHVLPEPLQKLARRNAFALSDIDWEYHVERLVTTLKHSVGSEAAAPSSVASEGGALNALADLMRTPEAYAAAAQYRSSFQTACKHIDMVEDYKKLHDQLDELQRRCYDPLVKQWNLPNVLDSVAEHTFDLDEVVDKIDSVIRKGHVSDQQIWTSSLKRTGATFREAVDLADMDKLKVVRRELQKILDRQPSHINDLICHEARQLDLTTLVDSLSSLWDRIAQSSGDSSKLEIIAESLAELRQLDADRVALVEAHNRWQWIEDELRRIEGQVGVQQDLAELELAWADLRERLVEQCAGCAEAWVSKLTESVERLETALASDGPNQTLNAFATLRRLARRRFYDVDDQLLALCEERLRPVGDSLRVVLRVIG
jgi:hypothetical protein